MDVLFSLLRRLQYHPSSRANKRLTEAIGPAPDLDSQLILVERTGADPRKQIYILRDRRLPAGI